MAVGLSQKIVQSEEFKL